MIKDYKGEMPKNVTTPEKAKAKKPFYKDWKFWVLTGLMTLFGACSIYGLVLGSQYVKAIERASHIIADAKEVSGQFSSKNKNLLPSPSAADSLSFNFTNEGGFEGTKIFRLDNGQECDTSNMPLYVPCFRINCSSSSSVALCIPFASSNNTQNIYLEDYINPLVHNRGNWQVTGFYHYTSLITSSNPFICSGTFHYQPYNAGYSTGYEEGHSDGYQDGYSDGSDAINMNQSVKVLLPAGVENSCSFTTYLDGVPDQQGILSSSSSFGAYGEFARNRNQKLRIDLALPSGSRAFFMYVPNWTSAYPSDENYSLRQSWAVSGVTYLPTWVDKPEIYVGITSALVDDLTYDTISVAFDVDHWGDVRVGAYQQGYQDGYVDGQENPTAYDSGYDAGYADGQAQGETDGFNRGVAVGSSGSQSLALMFKTAFQLPFDQLYRFLNFNLLGINFLSLFTALISVSIGIMVIKKVL